MKIDSQLTEESAKSIHPVQWIECESDHSRSQVKSLFNPGLIESPKMDM